MKRKQKSSSAGTTYGLIKKIKLPSYDHREEFEKEALPHYQRILHFAKILTKNDKDAEDITQTTFFNAFCDWESYKKGTNCRQWLAIRCKWAWISLHTGERRRKHRGSIDTELPWVKELSFPSSSQEEAFADEISSEIQRLSPIMRETLTLHYNENFSFEEIAQLMDTNVVTVKTRIFNAQKKLSAHLKEYAISQGIKIKKIR